MHTKVLSGKTGCYVSRGHDANRGGAGSPAQQPPAPQPPAYTIKNLGTLCVPTPELGCDAGLQLRSRREQPGASRRRFLHCPGWDRVFVQLVTGAFRTSAGQPINPATDLLHSVFDEGTAFAINDSGQVAGTIATHRLPIRAFILLELGRSPTSQARSTVDSYSRFRVTRPSESTTQGLPSAPLISIIFSCPSPHGHAARWTSVLQDLDG